MRILGINAYHADAAAVFVNEGELVAAVEEERLTRVKHWAGFPEKAVCACLDIAGVKGSEIDAVAVARDPRANLLRKAWFVLRRRPHPRKVLDRARNSYKVQKLDDPLREVLNLSESELPPVHHVEHHPAHLASAFFVSPFEEAAVAAIDGFGDFVSTSMAVGRGNDLSVFKKVYYPHSLGMVYTAITQFLGFERYGDEYKVMGLAPYGEPTQVEVLRELVDLRPDGGFTLDLDYFEHWRKPDMMVWDRGYPEMKPVYSARMEDLLGPARAPEAPLEERHNDIARSLQALYEESLFHVLGTLWRETGLRKLCLAGGCAMNSVANGKIRANTQFEEIYVQPAAGDNGTALGAAFHVWNQVASRERVQVMDHAFWGPAFPCLGDAVRRRLRDADGSFEVRCDLSEEELCRIAARMLADGKVIGWFQGRMEWGARALGNRSILADPRRPEMREIINRKIKFREEFRPFAPSIMEDAVDDYFEGAVNDPFMIQVYPVRPEKRSEIPAVTHVDGTGRLQAVSVETNPLYYRLLSEFRRITGVPVLLNTSFNENEPIVCRPEQALDCFLRTDMDELVIDNSIIERCR